REVAKHKIPFADELDTPLSRSFARAFDQGKGDGDSVEMTSAGTLMGKHLMDPDVRQDLINSYSAFSLSGATQLAWESVLAVVGFVALPLLVT
ncbi:unnamed protein product, partial [Symbiodinium microadriaticum]